MRKYFIILISSFCLSMHSYAQELSFSQPYTVGQTINPAIVGTGLYKQRIQSDLRSQFVEGSNLYSTIALGWDTRINNSKQTDIVNYLGVGFQIVSDRLMSGVIQNNYLSINMAYHIFLDKNLNKNIAMGLGGTYAQTTFDKSKLFFGDQYNSVGGLTGAGTMENLVASPSSGVVNTGILYTSHVENRFIQAGVSANFSNKPKFTYGYINESEGMKLVALLNAETALFYNNTVLFHGQYAVKNGVNNYEAGMAFSFPITSDWKLTERLYLGCFTRNAEVVMPAVSILSNKHSFGLSYDFNISKVNAAQLKQNVFEITFSQSFGYKKGPLFRTLFD